MQEQNDKRLFFGMEVMSPWPDAFPHGRLLQAAHRHLTLVFLGKTDFGRLHDKLPSLPTPELKVGLVGKFDQCLFLPPRHPHVVAWHVKWLEDPSALVEYRRILRDGLKQEEFPVDRWEELTPHVTLCRSPFNLKKWRHEFSPLPLFTKDIVLYESIGNLTYAPLWRFPLLPPFTEIEHTADLGFEIIGKDLAHLFYHAQTALSFHFPLLLPFFSERKEFSSLEDVIYELNAVVSRADQEIGVPFKAVSYHGNVEQMSDELRKWEMIIDV